MPISFNRTRNQLATLVMGKLGIVAAGGTPTSADSDLVYEAIDLRLKSMHTHGIYWRKVNKRPLSFAVTSGVNSASASVDILFPIAMTITQSSMDESVEIISINDYARIENKNDSGIPTKALWNGSAEFIFWPVPNATTTAKLTYESYAEDTSASAVVDVDVAMLRSLRDLICYDLGDFYQKSDQTMLRFKQEADIAERNIRKLGAQHVDLDAVRVDCYDDDRTVIRSDYGA